MQLTDEQSAAIKSSGRTIVSASAGSGKTFVMIEKLVNAVIGGADLDDVLAVTFTKKAAAQMKEKLRAAIIKKAETSVEEKAWLKTQLSKVSSANISTIHAFCARLIRTYFYALDGVDAGFDIISADDAVAKELKQRAADALFERLYEEDNPDFKHLLKRYMRKRSDMALRRLLWEAHADVRTYARYEQSLINTQKLYCEDGFKEVCNAYLDKLKNKIAPLICAVERYKSTFPVTAKAAIYNKIFDEMTVSLSTCFLNGLFGVKPPLSVTRKPVDAPADKQVGAEFKAFKDGIAKRYNSALPDLEDEAEEHARFLKSGETAVAFSNILLQLDREYAAVKRDENKLDYNDLEHLTLCLLENSEVKKEIISRFKYVFVDEYQDVNPVQEEIISALTGEIFLVGDVKQAIYGFRGSKSEFFSRKFSHFAKDGGNALKLSSNFRSSDGVLEFVNGLFSSAMRSEVCGINYAGSSVMRGGGLYPNGYGEAKLHIFGKESEDEAELDVYSVLKASKSGRHTREGLAVLSVVEKALCGKHYDLKSGKFVDTQAGDICILTRKNKGGSTDGIVRALLDEGYAVAGAQEANICELSEVKQVLDILSLIDNSEQDIPLVTALLSPLGGFCEDELAQIRLTFSNSKDKLSFRKCCEKYAEFPGALARKLNIFRGQLQKLRDLAEILPVGELIDELLETYGLECGFGAGGEQKVKNVLRLAEEGASLPLSAFLQKIKAGGYSVSAAAAGPVGSIKIMSMHASKGLEFPVVIIADICRTFKGQDYSEMPFDELYGFAPKCYDTQKLLAQKTVLRRLYKIKDEREELGNELNLFYVACTRAMCNLYIMCEEQKPFDPTAVYDAKCYADIFDISKFTAEQTEPKSEISSSVLGETMVFKPEKNLVESIESRFMQEYAHKNSVDLPVKSSASAILRLKDAEQHFAEHKLFNGEGETGTERGTAYHRFLELCDFQKRTLSEIEEEISNFTASGRMTEEQAKLLNAAELEEILKMPVFSCLEGAKLYREQEFLCRLKAKEVLETDADDGVLIQGAIDLLAEGSFGFKIIDYKYSSKSDAMLIETYFKQLALYKKAVALITGCSEEKISATIINIFRRRQIDLP